MMSKECGPTDLSIMNHLYREPVSEDFLKRNVDPSRWTDILDALSRLIGRKLVLDINKDQGSPIYKLSREGRRILEDVMMNKLDTARA